MRHFLVFQATIPYLLHTSRRNRIGMKYNLITHTYVRITQILISALAFYQDLVQS